ncbi:UNVERIFIED_CONTAM: hypothetical protein GTU68_025712 [Idotea baltica]|nr:hypothetical protein [Idotea baltica]
MGKSTTAAMFEDEGVPVWDADAAVRRLYAKGGAAVEKIAQHYPDAIEDGSVSRSKLRDTITANPKILDHIQTLVHPLVARDRADFLAQMDAPILIFDMPLLFEIGADRGCDGVVVVTAPAEVQKARVLARGEMSEADFDIIVSRQMSDEEKRAKATWVIETTTLDAARQSVKEILTEIREL